MELLLSGVFALSHGTVAIIVGCSVSLVFLSSLCVATWFAYHRCCAVRLRDHHRVINPTFTVEEDAVGGGSQMSFEENGVFINISSSPSKRRLRPLSGDEE